MVTSSCSLVAMATSFHYRSDEDMQSTYSHATSVSVASSMDYHDSDEDTSPFPMDGTNPTIIDEGSEEHKETKLISGGCGRYQVLQTDCLDVSYERKTGRIRGCGDT